MAKFPSKKLLISIIIPLFNEEKRLKNLVEIHRFLKSKNLFYEIIAVNDGSTDRTLEKLKNLQKELYFQLISYHHNKGKGFAIKNGMLKAKGKYRFFIDIDLSTPIEEVEKFVPFLGKADVLIGSRKIKGAKLVKRQSLLREVLGKSFTFLSQVVLQLNISDFTCGFKCFSQQASLKIFSKQKITRWGFDSEILYLAKKYNFSILELPVIWTNDPKSRVKFPGAVISSLFDLYRIRFHS